MRKILFLILSTQLLFASTLLEHKIFFYDNSTDLVLLCDKPYNGKISKKSFKNITKIIFKNLYFKKINRKLKSKLLSRYKIYQKNNSLILVLFRKKNSYVDISKSENRFEIRVKISTNKITPAPSPRNVLKKQKGLNYFLWIAFILSIGIICFYFYDKKKPKILKDKEIKIKDDKDLILIKKSNTIIENQDDKMLNNYMKKASK